MEKIQRKSGKIEKFVEEKPEIPPEVQLEPPVYLITGTIGGKLVDLRIEQTRH